jgi:LacI family transcriptional regulator
MAAFPRIMFLTETSSTQSRRILRGIVNYANLQGPWIFYAEPEEQKKLLPLIVDWEPDGIITRILSPQRASELKAAGIPTVVISGYKRNIEGFPAVVDDNLNIGEMGAQYFLNRGFRHFAFCGFKNRYWSHLRAKSFCGKIAKAGFRTDVYERLRPKSASEWRREQMLMAEWLKSLTTPVGLMACDDNHGRRIVETCKIAGLAVPLQIAVLGVDNDELACDLSTPSLSSIARNFEKAGYEVARLLAELIAGKKLPNETVVIHSTHVVTRQSTDIFAVEDPRMVKALFFIRENSTRPIQVDEVVAAAGLSRGHLERLFRTVLNHSVHDEIDRVRINQVTSRLLETNLSISQISSDLNYSSPEHMTRHFRKAAGTTPLAFRKKFGSK